MYSLSSGPLTVPRPRRVRSAHLDRAPGSPSARPLPRPARRALSRPAREQARLRAHFRRVLAELTARDVSHLSASQRANRARLLTELARYARTGRFPRNLDFPGRRMPYFIDAFGTRCAMAHLIESTGETALVARVAGAMNNAFVRELEGDVALAAWLDEAGLTVAEAARIQPTYCNEVWADECFCKHFTSARGAIEGTVVATGEAGNVTVRVDAVQVRDGYTIDEMVGQEIQVPSSAPVGSVVLFQVTGASEMPEYVGVQVVSPDGTVPVDCSYSVPPLMKDDALAAMAAGSYDMDPLYDPTPCGQVLAKVHPSWGNPVEPDCGEGGGAGSEQPSDGGGCSAGAAGDGSPLVLGAAVALAAVWSRRRARSRRPRHR